MATAGAQPVSKSGCWPVLVSLLPQQRPIGPWLQQCIAASAATAHRVVATTVSLLPQQRPTGPWLQQCIAASAATAHRAVATTVSLLPQQRPTGPWLQQLLCAVGYSFA